jgi:hypothetical protein
MAYLHMSCLTCEVRLLRGLSAGLRKKVDLTLKSDNDAQGEGLCQSFPDQPGAQAFRPSLYLFRPDLTGLCGSGL